MQDALPTPFDPVDLEVVGLVVSPRHSYDGRPSDGPKQVDPAGVPFDHAQEPPGRGRQIDTVAVRASKGLVGDRYFGTRHRFAAVTFLAVEEIERLEGELGTGTGHDAAQGPVVPEHGRRAPLPRFDPFLARRNVLTRGLDVESLVHTEFTLEVAGQRMTFRSLTRANPCAWMDVAFAPGAHQAMRGHAGIRTEPLDDGLLAVGPARLVHVRHLSPDDAAQLRREALEAARRGA